jgi:2-oxoglutarate ferredoxin oxidoreductase subunit alpha
MTELPVVIANIQRGGPSTGLPTKTEQATSAGDVWAQRRVPSAHRGCGDSVGLLCDGFRGLPIATMFMTPVFYLSDGYLATARSLETPEGGGTAED